MTRHYWSLAAVTAAGALALGLGLPAQASPDVSRTALSESRAARDALSQGHFNRAIEETERAETTLLNAKQAGDETAPQAYDQLKDAHQMLLDHNRDGALGSLKSVIDDLRAPTS